MGETPNSHPIPVFSDKDSEKIFPTGTCGITDNPCLRLDYRTRGRQVFLWVCMTFVGMSYRGGNPNSLDLCKKRHQESERLKHHGWPYHLSVSCVSGASGYLTATAGCGSPMQWLSVDARRRRPGLLGWLSPPLSHLWLSGPLATEGFPTGPWVGNRGHSGHHQLCGMGKLLARTGNWFPDGSSAD